MNAVHIIATPPAPQETRQSDVKNIFLNRVFKEEVYVEQPLEYEVGEGQVLRLRKTHYGLKQSPREWRVVLSKDLEYLVLRRSTFDPSMFVARGNTLIIIAFIDDLGIFFSEPIEDKRVTDDPAKTVRKSFENLAHDRWRSNQLDLTLRQSTYIRQVLGRFHMIQDQRVPAEPGTATHQKIAHYQEVIGSLIYTVLGTRPDIIFINTFI